MLTKASLTGVFKGFETRTRASFKGFETRTRASFGFENSFVGGTEVGFGSCLCSHGSNDGQSRRAAPAAGRPWVKEREGKRGPPRAAWLVIVFRG